MLEFDPFFSDGQRRVVSYKNQGTIDKIRDKDGNVLGYSSLDILDRVVWSTNVYGQGVTNLYDALGRITNMADSAGVTVARFDAKGLLSLVDAAGHMSGYLRDAAGRVLISTNGNGETNTYTFNSDGSLGSVQIGQNNKTSFAYDQYGRLLREMNYAGTTVSSNMYDVTNRLVSRWSAGTTYAVTTRYDRRGNLTNTTYVIKDGQSGATNSVQLKYTYDSLDRLQTMTDQSGCTTFTYTNFGAFSWALMAEDGPWDNDTVVNYYDAYGRQQMAAVAQPSGALVQNFGYDAYSRLSSITSGAGTFTFDYEKTTGSRLSKFNLPGGSDIRYTFTGRGELQETTLRDRFNNIVSKFAYTYGNDGNRSRTDRADGSYVSYTYDNIGQLRSATGYNGNNVVRTNEAWGYGYDMNGNMVLKTHWATPTVTQYSVSEGDNKLTNITRPTSIYAMGNLDGPVNSMKVNGSAAAIQGDYTYYASVTLTNPYTTITTVISNKNNTVTSNRVALTVPVTTTVNYSADENMLNLGTNIVYWNGLNQMTNLLYPSLTNSAILGSTEFVYDGLGRLRIRREFSVSGGSATKTNECRYIYSGFDVVQERDGNNLPVVSYTLGHGLVARTDSSGSAYYHVDGNNNVVAMVDGNGRMKAKYLYGPYGQLLGKWGSLADANTRRFSSKEYHPQSGLYYYGFRWYDPSIQRWINADPIGLAGGRNKHAFVGNNPINFVDLYGLDSWWSRLGDSIVEGFGSDLFFGKPLLSGEKALNEMIWRNAERTGLSTDALADNLSYHTWEEQWRRNKGYPVANDGWLGDDFIRGMKMVGKGAAYAVLAVELSRTPTASSSSKCTTSLTRTEGTAAKTGASLLDDACFLAGTEVETAEGSRPNAF